MDTSQKDGAALHGSSSCNARCCTLHPTGLGLIAHIPPAAPVAKTRRDRHDRSSSSCRIDGIAPHHESAASAALTSIGCNHRLQGTSGGQCAPRGAVGGICMPLGYAHTVVTFLTLRTSMYRR